MIRHSYKTSESWVALPWKKFRRNLFRLQKRVYKAVQVGDKRKARSLQKLILKSTSARFLAIRLVSQLNAGKKTAGIDGKKSLTFSERFYLEEWLRANSGNWKHQGLREIPIPKKDGTTRMLKIPTIADRAWQCLAKYALEAAHEATFHARSYGFRTGRSAHDAQKHIYNNLNSSVNGIEKRTHSNKSISDIKNDVKTKSRIIKNSLSFGNQGVMLCQLEQIKIVQKDLISINKNFQNIINTIEKGKITYIKSTTLESLLLLFGSICAVEFSPKDELFIDFNSQNEKVLDILSFCQKLQPKIETLIQEGEGKIKEAQECLKNPLLMKQCQRQQRRKSVQITTAIVASILILISPGVWFGWKRFSQEQVRWNAQTLMSSIGDVTQAKDINEIRLMRDKIKQAIASVEIIPNSFASAYLAAHQDISKFRVQLDPVEKRLQIEEDTAAKFESTKQLAMDAAILVQNPPHPATVWNEASNKWQEAITILESIPEDSFVSVDAKTKLEQYRNNYAVISARLSSEIQASDSIENAKKLSWEAVKITQNPPHSSTTWKQASNKLEQAIKLLGTMPKNSPLYAQEQQRLQEYKANYTTINKRLIIEDNAVLKFKQAQKLAKQVERIAQNTPYTLAGLQDALAKIKQATNVLSSIPSGTTVSVQASEVVQIYSRNYNTIYNRFQAINTCSSPQSSDCFDANYSFYLESIDSSLSSL